MLHQASQLDSALRSAYSGGGDSSAEAQPRWDRGNESTVNIYGGCGVVYGGAYGGAYDPDAW